MIQWTVTWQTTLFMDFSRQEHWSGWPFPSPGDLPNPEIEAGSPALWTDSLPSELPGKPWKVDSNLDARDVTADTVTPHTLVSPMMTGEVKDVNEQRPT